MKFYLFAVKFYKSAIFSSKKTFTSFVPWMLTPLDNNMAVSLMFSGQRTEQLHKSFFMSGFRKIRVSDMTNWMETQLGEFKSSNRETGRVEIIEDLECNVSSTSDGIYSVSFKSKPKYMRDFTLTYHSELSSKHRKMIFVLDGDIQIEDFVADVFEGGKVKQRLDLSKKFLDIKG